jgi:hypothetical protein
MSPGPELSVIRATPHGFVGGEVTVPVKHVVEGLNYSHIAPDRGPCGPASGCQGMARPHGVGRDDWCGWGRVGRPPAANSKGDVRVIVRAV